MSVHTLRLALLALPLLIASCAPAPPRAQVEAVIKARTELYWEHRMKGRFSKAYEFEAPQFRKAVPLDAYSKTVSGGASIVSVEVLSVSLDRDTAVVTMAMYHRPGMSVTPRGGIRRELPDYWSLIDGVWYHRMRDPRRN